MRWLPREPSVTHEIKPFLFFDFTKFEYKIIAALHALKTPNKTYFIQRFKKPLLQKDVNKKIQIISLYLEKKEIMKNLIVLQ